MATKHISFVVLATTVVAVSIGSASQQEKQRHEAVTLNLMKERKLVLQNLIDIERRKFELGESTFEEVERLEFELLDAELELATTIPERIVIRESMLKLAKERESRIAKQVEQAELSPDTALKAKANRLRVEIDLQLERAVSVSQQPTKQAATTQEQSLSDRVELAKIQAAIALQVFAVAKAERRVLISKRESSAVKVQTAVASLAYAEQQLAQAEKLRDEALMSKNRIVSLKANRDAYRSGVEEAKAALRAIDTELGVNDEQIKLLELRAEMSKTKLEQLHRRFHSR